MALNSDSADKRMALMSSPGGFAKTGDKDRVKMKKTAMRMNRFEDTGNVNPFMV